MIMTMFFGLENVCASFVCLFVDENSNFQSNRKKIGTCLCVENFGKHSNLDLKTEIIYLHGITKSGFYKSSKKAESRLLR